MSKSELFSQLDNWIFLNIADDIYRSPENRPEFKDYVDHCRELRISEEKIPQTVLGMIASEARRESNSILFKIKKALKR